MRFLGAVLLLLVGSPLGWASVLEVGPIYINGSGSVLSPQDEAGTVGVFFTASGSNGTDSVSFNAPAGPGLAQVFVGDSPPILTLPGAECFGIEQAYCYASIDGITGIGEFTNIGDGYGIVQVYTFIVSPETEQGPLLAEAQVYTNLYVTSWMYTGLLPGQTPEPPFLKTFNLVSPEPSAWSMGLIGGRHSCGSSLAETQRRRLRHQDVGRFLWSRLGKGGDLPGGDTNVDAARLEARATCGEQIGAVAV